MNIYDNIDKIYFINLEYRKDRCSYIQNHLQTYFPDKSIEKFNAILPQEAKQYPFVKSICKDSSKVEKYPGIIGCYCSHLCLLKRLYHTYKNNSKDKFVLIFEDDTYFDDTFINILKKPFTLNNWNILLGINPSCNIKDKPIHKISDYIKQIPQKNVKKPHLFGTNVVIYNLNNIDKIYKQLLLIDKIKEIDYIYIYLMQDTYFFNTNYIQENKEISKSDITYNYHQNNFRKLLLRC